MEIFRHSYLHIISNVFLHNFSFRWLRSSHRRLLSPRFLLSFSNNIRPFVFVQIAFFIRKETGCEKRTTNCAFRLFFFFCLSSETFCCMFSIKEIRFCMMRWTSGVDRLHFFSSSFVHLEHCLSVHLLQLQSFILNTRSWPEALY